MEPSTPTPPNPRRTPPAFPIAVALIPLLAAIFATLTGPPVLDLVERLAGRPLSYEVAMRCYLLVAGAWSGIALAALALARPGAETVVAGWWLAGSGAAVAVVCLVDFKHHLQDEFSLIRYTTAACLLATATLAALIVATARGTTFDDRVLRRTWMVVGAGFLFLAADELLQIHENVADRVATMNHLPHAFIDYVTLGYAVVGIGLALWIGPRVLRLHTRRHPGVLRLFGAGAAVYLVAQLLDTTDRWFLPWLRARGAALSVDPARLLSEFWYVAWAPKRMFNSLEEVLENLAAGLFAAAATLLILERRGWRPPARWSAPRPRLALGIVAALTVASVVAIAMARPTAWTESPIPGRIARRLIGAEHGLLHADAGDSHPVWGLLVANEGAGTVVVYRDGAVRTLPPPADVDAELDAVAADSTAIYASLSARHAIVRYTNDRGWEPVAVTGDGLGVPEGLAVVDTTLYVLDETLHRVNTLGLATGALGTIALDIAKCPTPEGIAYHPGLGELLITDDKTGIILALRPGGGSRTFADPSVGLKGPEDIAVGDDGHVFVADPGRREIVEFGQDGRVLDRIRFGRMFGDVVGVEVAGSGPSRTLYVVSSDASRNDAFVPSALWEIPDATPLAVYPGGQPIARPPSR